MVLLGSNGPEKRHTGSMLYPESILIDARSDPYTLAETLCNLSTGWDAKDSLQASTLLVVA